VRLFTVDLELGDKTLETLTQISSSSVIRIELGPETRSMIEHLWMPKKGGDGVTGLVKKGAEALRSDS
jgi:hypothetical protein